MNDQKRSCENCPSFLEPFEVPRKFKRPTGSAMCGRYGFPLDRPGVTDPKVVAKQHEHFASKCDAYGEDMPGAPVEKRMVVALPNPTVRKPAETEEARQQVMGCGSCKKFIRDDAVSREFGWTTGLCSAHGRLVQSHEQVFMARNCEYRDFGSPLTSTETVTLFAEYADDFGKFNPVKATLLKIAEQVEPTKYISDLPVLEEEKAEGVLAWRKIEDPESGKFTHLPVFDSEHFDENDRELIPKTGDDEHPELYVDHFRGVYLAAVCWQELNETPALWGEAGTGKTELFRHLAWLMQLPFRRISITGSTELDDIAGKMRFNKEKGTYFQYGRLPIAWQRPGVICIDEPNTGPPDVWQFLRPLTDNSKQLVVDANEGEVIRKNDSAYLGLAMNPSWDVRNVGTIELGDADANRLFHVYVELPPEEVEREIIRSRIRLDGYEIEDSRLDLVMNIAKDLRALIAEGGLTISWAIRPQIKVARALKWFDPITAYMRAVGDYLEPAARQAILDTVHSHVE